MKKVSVGVIGCGAISGAYLSMAKNFPILDIAACADLDLDRAKSVAQKFDSRRAMSVDDILADESIEIILNLTIPKAHVPINLRAINAGKHVYTEKPLGITREEAWPMMEQAKAKGVRVGCAPDTFLGAGLQTARKLLDGGAIGRPVAFTAFMMCPGHESWHPSPEFYYESGGGPMLDMGPYYVTALLNCFGAAKRFNGLSSIAIPERTIGSQPKFGKKIAVETPDHICGTIEFENGVVGTIIQSFAARFATYDGKHPITIYGETGTMKVPDPNHFDGVVMVRTNTDADFVEVPHQFVKGYGRAVGLADMATAIRVGRKHRCSEELAMAGLDLMLGVGDSSVTGKTLTPRVKFERPEPMKAGGEFGTLE